MQVQLLFSFTGNNPFHMSTQVGPHFNFDVLGISIEEYSLDNGDLVLSLAQQFRDKGKYRNRKRKDIMQRS